LIKVGDNGPLSATAKVLSDGLGNDSPIAMSTTLVGIGTSTPYTSLTIGNTDATAEISSGGANTHLTLKTVGASGALRFFTIGGGTNTLATTESMRITSAGNVGIGTTTPSAKLHVSSGYTLVNNAYSFAVNNSAGSAFAAQFGAAADVGFALGGNNTIISAAGANAILLGTNNVERIRVDADGIKFNGDTAAANALDDYEEGTWTPSFSGTTFSGTIGATYTKIGRVVNVQMNFVNQTLSSSSGTAAISGLPFTCNSVTFGMVNFTFCDSLTASVATGYVGVSGTSIQIRTNTGVSDTTFVDGTSNKSMMLSATYFV
jgi:hypothetical protein